MVPKAGFDLDHFNFSSIDEEFTRFGIGFNRLRHTIEQDGMTSNERKEALLYDRFTTEPSEKRFVRHSRNRE